MSGEGRHAALLAELAELLRNECPRRHPHAGACNSRIGPVLVSWRADDLAAFLAGEGRPAQTEWDDPENERNIACPMCLSKGESWCKHGTRVAGEGRQEPGATFNINENVRVRLNERGRAILRRRHEELAEYLGKPVGWNGNGVPPEDADGWSTWQLWSLMEAFGQHMYLGCEAPFETTIALNTVASPAGDPPAPRQRTEQA